MGLDDVEETLPDLCECVPDFCRCLVDREPALARNPEWGIGRDTGRGEHLLHIAVNLIRVEAVSVVRGAEASILGHAFGPGLVVVAHRAWHSLHSLDVKKYDGAVFKALSRGFRDGIV